MSLLLKTAPGTNVEDIKAIPEDIYELELIDRNEPAEYPAYQQDPNSTETKMQVRCRLEFQIVDHDPGPDEENLNGQRVGDFFTVSLHEKSRLRPFVRAMRGGNDEFDEATFDLDTLIASKNGTGKGGRLRAGIQRKPNGYNTVVNPMPSKTARRTVAAEPVDPNHPPF